MLVSKFVPVNINRANEAMLSAKGEIPIADLKAAYTLLHDDDESAGAHFDKGLVCTQSGSWSIAEVVSAWKYYQVALESYVTFFTVNDEYGDPVLLVSRQMNNRCMLVNLLSWEGIIVEDDRCRARLREMIDRQYPMNQLLNMYLMLKNYTVDREQFVQSLIVNRGTKDEVFVVAPCWLPYEYNELCVPHSTLDEWRQIIEDGVKSTENYQSYVNSVASTSSLEIYPKEVLKFVLDLYDECLKTKSSYHMVVCSEDCVPLYVSTSLQYVVHGVNYKRYDVKNVHMQTLLQNYCNKGVISQDDYLTLIALLE